jgi:predicted glycoside hydrolase/deacetylase ChbG (UPF0249 family)
MGEGLASQRDAVNEATGDERALTAAATDLGQGRRTVDPGCGLITSNDMIRGNQGRRPPMKKTPEMLISFTILTLLIVATLLTSVPAPGGAGENSAAKQLLIRCDDVGMSHTVNVAVRRLVETGIPFSTSVMIACPWYLEAVEILKANPQIGVGVHLTLNSEWKSYKWGPVLGAAKVPSLVDENGHFYASSAEFAAADVDLEEVEMELRAQIERAFRAGLRVDYLDYHMLTPTSTPEMTAIVENLAAEYGLGLARYFGESSVSIWADDPEDKLTRLLGHVRNVKPGLSLMVIHLGMETPEMSALVDLNNENDPYRVAIHRQAELDAVTSPAFRQALADARIELVTYRDIVSEMGLESMAKPADLNSYDSSFAEEN